MKTERTIRWLGGREVLIRTAGAALAAGTLVLGPLGCGNEASTEREPAGVAIPDASDSTTAVYRISYKGAAEALFDVQGRAFKMFRGR